MKIYTKIKLQCSFLMVMFFLASSNLLAQSDPSGTKRVTGNYAIKNATITTSPGKTISGATIVLKDGLISAVGTNITIPAGTDIINGDSLFIYPGFIDGASSAGISRPADLERPSNFDSSNPSDELAGITPWRNVLDQLDMNSNSINDWRKAGFTIAQMIPDGGMISGKSAIVVFGSPNSTNVLMQNTAVSARFRGSRGMYPGTPLGVMAKFRDVYKNAELSSKHTNLFTSNSGLNRPEINKTLVAMYPVLDKNIPVIFEVSNDLEIRRALRLQKELGFKLVLSGVTEVEKVIQEIKAANATVLLALTLPEDKTKNKSEDLSEEAEGRTNRVKEAYESALKQAGILEKEGVKFGFTTNGSKSGDLMKNIKIMIENGLSEDAALAALTINSAENLGIQKFAGTLDKGKLANMVITTAPLFSEDAQIKHVVADGYVFDYETKAKKASNGNKNGKTSEAVAGTWEYMSETPAGSSGGTMTIGRSGDSYEGTITYDDPSGNGKAEAPMKNIIAKDNALSFSFDVSAGGMEIKVSVSGDISDEKFTGKMSLAEFGSFPLTATKKPNQSNL
ncbi:amidohydrolase family protein [Belliella sp. R4-6]|uniref:Amidohydrolase family protein n=1 Tax=Belliella alkalica TaxID=1730871 RepID=A0ABS9VGH7_9BACT|nr:amidohydrolase family protein [Belliella alkalica]MCH7415536.1 amidohydrolase family protein [Belliella alkalica]